ncbi:MAG TPA: hypothetical protein VK611_25790 [Acidimicrobiales bacterium]|nr:hypothetical protein [Acidimicrobiales bacterium]
MDERVFVRIIVRRAGFDLSEAELTAEAVEVVRNLCQQLDNKTPHSPEAEFDRELRLSSYFEPPQPTPASGSSILDRCIVHVLPADRNVAYRALVGLRPDLRAQGQLSRYKPVARAKLAGELRTIGRPVLAQFARWGRFSDTDKYIDAEGVRQAGPAALPEP